MVQEGGDAPRRYPYDPLGDLHDETRYLLHVSKKSKDGDLPHIPTFARRMLEYLRDVGLLDGNVIDPRNVPDLSE